MLHLCVRHVAAAGDSAQVGLSGIYMEMVPSPPSAPSPFLHLYQGDAAPFPFPSQWDTRHPSLQRDTGKTTRKRLHSRVDRCLWQVDKGLQATDRLDTHYDAPTYEFQLLGIREVCSFEGWQPLTRPNGVVVVRIRSNSLIGLVRRGYGKED